MHVSTLPPAPTRQKSSARRALSFLVALTLILPTFAHALPSFAASADVRTVTFDPPIDGLSAGSTSLRGEVRGLTAGGWTPWTTLTVEDDDDPGSTESQLVLFPGKTATVELRGVPADLALHPVRVSSGPLSTRVARRVDTNEPHIFSRSEWGADESLRIRTGSNGSTSSASTADSIDPDNGSSTTLSQRQRDCQEAYRLYPQEFRTERRVTTDASGNKLLWPQDYSPSVKLIAVHHTAMEVTNDSRPPEERMRALYAYHAANKKWGDIGYHYVIDEQGHVYQGRAGGESVVGGHAYCNNVGTIGIALMGNFEMETPSQAQIQSLQWLANLLASEYNIDMSRTVTFHGKTLQPLVGHRDLLSTSCPGHYVYGVLDQVREHVRQGNLQATVTFPPPPSKTSSSAASRGGRLFGLSAVGSTALVGRPGGELTIALTYTADTQVRRGQNLGLIARSNPRIGVWVLKDESSIRLRTSLLSPQVIGAGQQALIRLKLQLPRDRGAHILHIGPLTFTLSTEGRSIPSGPRGTASSQTYIPPASASPSPDRIRPNLRRSSSSSLSSSSYDYPVYNKTSPPSSGEGSGVGETQAGQGLGVGASNPIRILLTDASLYANTADVTLLDQGTVNGTPVAAGTLHLSKEGDTCVAKNGSAPLASGIVRIDPSLSTVAVTSFAKPSNRYRGILECRVVDGALALINELPLEDYMAGIAEEPDTEPAEKQKAFAIAARTYAAYYMDKDHRKFPGKPYDGSDSPALFQLYAGVATEEKNPRWAKIVRDTAGQVLTNNGYVIRAPYFSSDDGRTRSPKEAGWNNFPYADIFASKPDPWCKGMTLAGHGVGMSGCGARGQAYEGKTYDDILEFYYPGTEISVYR